MTTIKRAACMAVHEDFLQGDIEAMQLAGGLFSPAGFAAAQGHSVFQNANSIATVGILGALTLRRQPEFTQAGLANTSTLELEKTFNVLAADSKVKTVFVYVNSPGGEVRGVEAAAKALAGLAKKKKVVVYTDEMNASAAYWISSQGTELWASPHASVGSVGVYLVHVSEARALEAAGLDVTVIQSGQNKVEGSSLVALSEEARTHYQEKTDALYNSFVATVANGRGLGSEKVLADFGQGRCFDAKTAFSVKMIDKVGTLEQCLASLASEAKGYGAARAAQAKLILLQAGLI